MKNRFSILVFIVSGLMYLVLLGNSAGAPVETTGAPSESTCGRSGCHAVTENTGDATVALSYGTGMLTYNPQEVYPINIALSNLQNETKNGFQIVALDSLNNNAGTWELVEDTNTQIQAGTSLADRSYVTHTSVGNTLNAWDMNWIAPSEDVGPITFYLAVNDADSNRGRTGDAIYITNLSVTSSSNTTTSTTSLLAAQIAVYPNPTSQFLTIHAPNLPIQQAKLYTATGHLIQQQMFPNRLDVSTYPEGLYLLELQTENGVVLKKILVQ